VAPAESRFLRSARYSLRSGRNDKKKAISHLINSPEQQVEVPQGLKPSSLLALDGTNVVPFPNPFTRWLLATVAKGLSYGAGIAAATAEDGALSSSLELRAVVS
jgi:hypothetical protein